MKEILDTERNKNKNNKNSIEQKLKEKEKDTINNLIKIAISDIGDNFGESDPIKKEKSLKRNINHISDEQALGIIDEIIEKHQELDVRKIIGNDKKSKMKRENNMKLIREKTKNNYEKMLKLTNMIQIDKKKFFK